MMIGRAAVAAPDHDATNWAVREGSIRSSTSRSGGRTSDNPTARDASTRSSVVANPAPQYRNMARYQTAGRYLDLVLDNEDARWRIGGIIQ